MFCCILFKQNFCLNCIWARSSAGRVPRSQCGGRGFDPLRVHHGMQIRTCQKVRICFCVRILYALLHHVVADFLSFATTFFIKSHRSFRRSSFPNRTHFVGLRFGLTNPVAAASILLGLHTTRKSESYGFGFCFSVYTRKKSSLSTCFFSYVYVPAEDSIALR